MFLQAKQGQEQISPNHVPILKPISVGVRDAFSPHAVLELISVSVGEVRIRSVETGLYLSMGSDGKVRAESSADSEETVFIESVSGPYLTYLRYMLKLLPLGKLQNFC